MKHNKKITECNTSPLPYNHHISKYCKLFVIGNVTIISKYKVVYKLYTIHPLLPQKWVILFIKPSQAKQLVIALAQL